MSSSVFSDDSGLQELLKLDQEITDLAGAQALMQWDQRVNMPPKGVQLRSKQLSTLTGLIHDRKINPRIGELLEGLEKKLVSNPDKFSDFDRGYIRQMRRDYDQAAKLPRELVQALTEAASQANQTWEKAKKEDDFSLFQSDLERVFKLTLEKADHLGFKKSRYDALLDLYEPGATEEWLKSILGPLRQETIQLLDKILGSKADVGDEILFGEFDLNKQESFGREVAQWLGYDLQAGRLDISAHPFTIDLFGPQDVRITTRVKRQQINYALMSTIHEVGHAVYEQNVTPSFARTSLHGGISLGIHESQSKFFENIVGRSLSFWRYWYPKLQKVFADQLPQDGLMEFYKAVNLVRPSLIRVEADEVTYNLHIVLRFEIESELIQGKIEVGDLPEVWQEKMKDYLGVTPETDKEGVLQDIHWSSGAFGYFPTYSLGNLYSAQFAHKLKQNLDMEELMKKGEFGPIRKWLTKRIHQWGHTYMPDELVQKVTGEKLNPKYFVEYLNKKFEEIYSF